MPYEHSMSCSFPEGCDCGASAYNTLEERCRKAEAFAARIEAENSNISRLMDRELAKISELLLGEKKIDESLSNTVFRLLIENRKLKAEFTHPQIDLSYYDWLNQMVEARRADPEDFEANFWKTYCPDYANFHAIAMWVWQRSREDARKRIDPDYMEKIKAMQARIAANTE